jgi:hypothetical protein
MRVSIRSFVMIATVGLALVVGAPSEGAQRRAVDVHGEYIQPGGVTTGYDPETGKFTAIGTAIATGDWTGYWYEQIEFTVDPSTFDIEGTVLQTFTGSASDGTSGSLAVFERFTIDGSTHLLRGEGKILSGTGDWEGSRGTYEADGVNSGANGTWSAHWVRPVQNR